MLTQGDVVLIKFVALMVGAFAFVKLIQLAAEATAEFLSEWWWG